MSQELYNFFRFISIGSPAIPLLVGILFFKRISRTQKTLLILVVVALTTEITAYQLHKSKILVNNIVIYNAYTLIAFNCLWILYRYEIALLKKRIALGLQFIINIFGILNASLIQGWNSFNSNLMIVTAISFLILATLSFRQILQQVKYTRLEKTPIFWINTGIFIYYSGTLILFALSNKISVDPSAANLHLVVWALNCIFNSLLNTAYGFALWQRPKK